MKEIKQIEQFNDHVATYTVINDQISVLDWKKPGTIWYSIRYVFDRNRIYITGDLGDAIYDLTWQAKLGTFDINFGYFMGKLSCCSRDKFHISSNCVDQLNEWFKDIFEYEDTIEVLSKFDDDLWHSLNIDLDDYDGVEDKEVIKNYLIIKNCLQNSSTPDEYANYINSSELDTSWRDCWEWVYNIGKEYNGVFELYLIGLNMAYEQLKERGEIS